MQFMHESNFHSYSTSPEEFLKKALCFADGYQYFCLLNGNNYSNGLYPVFPMQLAIGNEPHIESENDRPDIDELKKALEADQHNIFGIISYDIKNALEKNLVSQNKDNICAPSIAFFRASIIIQIDEKGVKINSAGDTDEIFNKIENQELNGSKKYNGAICDRIKKTEYIDKISQLQKHIKQGDIYEINFCMEFFAENIELDPISTYLALNNSSSSPFSALFKWDSHYLISASPERFIKKSGNKLLSQPIKGTRKRSSSPQEDKRLAEELYNDPKERAENVMIVDLVRNDLTPFCKTASIKVEELFGIYGFSHVYQMISSISAELINSKNSINALLNAFPMGSMTGAPKIKAMELIEEYEESKRGWYSGALGYINKNGDYDFSVIIRSVVYNQNNNTASIQAGSAITYDAIPESEYEECLLKADAIIKALRVKIKKH